ncbi:unnamed protein product [Brassicogethes aeneus]|uniref:Zinc finger C2HC domain-containing protein 1A n=1 Tax=Brassicogethes aeneus TaxID=1431903 RepID=A0A9P0FN95_BRAAE|nr:unnamed protein product [Brassicogethes aeneus]
MIKLISDVATLFYYLHGEIEVTTQSQHLAPCQTCGRTFLPSPLRKHEKICQKNAAKKRRVFNSLKQRVEGTDLAAFHMNQVLKPVLCQPPPQETHKPKPSKWKEKHLELVTAIRAARGAADDSPGSTAKRATGIGAGNERCPSCDRQFGPKAFDRHVEWCKEHKARIQKSPASNLAAKERLEARTKYRVPPLNKSKRSLTREKYKESPTSINSPEVKSYSTTTLSRTPSIRKPNSVANVRKKPEEKMPALEKHQLQPAKVEGTKSTYDPFESAQRQFMELLEDDLVVKPFKSTLSTPRHDLTKTNTPLPARKDRASVIEPPRVFQDSLESVNDDFELLESLIKEEASFFSSNNNAARKYSDDMSVIDPSLINENDNLSIPDHLKLDDLSPTSTNGTDTTLRNEDITNGNTPEVKQPAAKPVIKRSVSLINRSDSIKLKEKTNSATVKQGRYMTTKNKVLNRSVSSVKDKKGLPILKKQMSFEPTPKPVLKSKEDVNNYFNNTRGTPDKEVVRSEESLKPEDLFAVDDEMFEEYKKYEEMYLKEKEKGSVSNKKCKPKLENFGILTASEDEHSPQITNLANDSAYGSLQRKTPKHRSRAAKLAPLEPPKRPDSTSSSGSEQIAPKSPKECNQKLSKFCHECGNKYPVTSAKFCVECGVKRLIL